MPGKSSWRSRVTLLALGTFAIGTDSFVLAGILPQLSADLHISIASAGQVITVFALTYAVLAPFLAALTHRVPRRLLIITALGVFILGNLAGALAPNLALLLVARVATAIGAALYTPTANGAAMALAGPERHGTALSIVLGGLASGTVFGVPLGTALGQAWGWQASLIFIAAIAVAALVALILALPGLPLPQRVSLRERVSVMVRGRVLLVATIATLATASGILFYTYIGEVLTSVAHATAGGLVVALLLWGIGAALGAFGGGPLTDRIGPTRTLAIAIASTSVAIAALGFAGTFWLAAPLLVIGGASSWMVNTPANHLASGLVPTMAPVAISFVASGSYLGQAIGAATGGALLAGGLTPTALCLTASLGSVATLVLHLSTRGLTAANRLG